MNRVIKLEKLGKGFFKDLKVFAAIGFFDGVHRGHQQIIKKCINRAGSNRGVSLVFTFDKPPRNIVRGSLQKKLITSCTDKLKLISQLGVDFIIIAKFNRYFSGLEPEEFCSKILQEKLNIQELFIGKGFRFGKDARGNTSFLIKFFEPQGKIINEVPLFKIKGVEVSSTAIRKFYQDGEIEKIKEFLGRYPTLKGKVISGDQRGRLMGFPTANLDVFEKYVTPRDGVYAGTVEILGRSLLDIKEPKGYGHKNTGKLFSLINVGDNPTFELNRKWVESYILDFEGDIYGQKIEVTFLKRLRDEKKFECQAGLVKQISQDIKKARYFFAKGKFPGL